MTENFRTRRKFRKCSSTGSDNYDPSQQFQVIIGFRNREPALCFARICAVELGKDAVKIKLLWSSEPGFEYMIRLRSSKELSDAMIENLYDWSCEATNRADTANKGLPKRFSSENQ